MLYFTDTLKTFYQKTYLFIFISVVTPMIFINKISEKPLFFVVIEILITSNHVISFSTKGV